MLPNCTCILYQNYGVISQWQLVIIFQVKKLAPEILSNVSEERKRNGNDLVKSLEMCPRSLAFTSKWTTVDVVTQVALHSEQKWFVGLFSAGAFT